MKPTVFALFICALVACKDDDDPTPSNYPVNYVFDRIDQSDEGQYLVNANSTLTDLSTEIGLFGAFKDSLKMEIQEVATANLELEGVEIVDEDDIKLHYILQGFEIVTPVKYALVNGDIILTDSNQLGLISYDHTRDEFILCGKTPFALPGPNAVNPVGPPYLQFNVEQCTEGHTNRDYAVDFLNANTLYAQDTIAVLISKYFFRKQ